MRVVAFSLLLLLAQDSDISRWIDDLAHEELGRRDEAQAQLLKAGEPALAALKKARETATGERAHRLDAIIDEVERPAREREHDARERAKCVKVYTVDFKEVRSADAFAELFSKTKGEHKFLADPDSKVTVVLKDAPLQKILDALEDELNVSVRRTDSGWEITRGKIPRRPRAYLPGYTIEFKARPSSIDGKHVGIRIKAVGDGYGSSMAPESWDIRGADGTERKYKTCPNCGPGLVLAEAGEDEKLTVRVKGQIRWESIYQWEVHPEASRTWRVSDFRVTYQFPKVTVSTVDGSSRDAIPFADLVGELKTPNPPATMGFGGRFGQRERAKRAWCDCAGEPPPMVEKVSSREHSCYEEHKPSDFKWMKVFFFKPMTEPFDTGVIPLD